MTDVLVVGSIHFDRMIRLAQFPEPGETALALENWSQVGGKAANQAMASAALTPTRLAAAVGDDPESEQVRRVLKQHGVAAHLHVSTSQPTGSSVALIDAAGENIGIISPAANTELTSGDVLALSEKQRPALILLQWETPLNTLREVLQSAREQGIPSMMNAAPWREDYRELLPLADHVIVNAVEAAAWLGHEVASQAAHLEFNHPKVTVTLGKDGASHYQNGALVTHQSALKVKVESTHGAGDRFVGTLAALVAQGQPLEQALTEAGKAAAQFIQTLHKTELSSSL